MNAINKSIFILIICLSNFHSYAQDKSGSITYEHNIIISDYFKGFWGELSDALATDSTSSETLNENQIVETFEDVFKLSIKVDFSKDSLVVSKYLSEEKTTLLRVNYQENEKIHLRWENYEPKIDTTEFDGVKETDKFTLLEVYEEQTKNILGYDCFKILLSEDGSKTDKPGQFYYEMYVTEEIGLPTFLFKGLPEKITKILTAMDTHKHEFNIIKLGNY